MRLIFGFAIALVAFGATGVEYFPAGSLAETAKEHQFLAEWYSGQLSALQEPSVWKMSQQKPTVEVYRFLYLRTFHHPISVRLTIASDGTGLLTSKETNGAGGYEPGRLIRNTATKLTKDQAGWFRDDVDRFGFWKLPARRDTKGEVGLDGAQWIVEGSKDGRYHIVDRWSPSPDDPIHSLGTTMMINLARFRLLYEDVY